MLQFGLQNAIIRCQRAHAPNATLASEEMLFELFVERAIPLCGKQNELQRLGIQTLFPDHLGGPRDPIPLAKIVFLHASIVIFSSLPQQPSVQGGFGVLRLAVFRPIVSPQDAVLSNSYFYVLTIPLVHGKTIFRHDAKNGQVLFTCLQQILEVFAKPLFREFP